MSDEADELLRLYGRYRIQDQVAYYEYQADRNERALRRSVIIAALLFIAATLCGALATANAPGGRGMWAFLSAGFAALATALTAYEVAFGFERYSRQYAETLASLKLADANRPPDIDAKAVVDHVILVETLLRSEGESWSQLYASQIADQTAESPAATRRVVRAFVARVVAEERGGAYVVVPPDVVEALGGGKRIPVLATFDGIEYRGSIVSMGGGGMILGVLKSIRSARQGAGGRAVGEGRAGHGRSARVDVPATSLPPWQRPAYGRRSTRSATRTSGSTSQWIEEAKRPDTRSRRIAETVDRASD